MQGLLRCNHKHIDVKVWYIRDLMFCISAQLFADSAAAAKTHTYLHKTD